MLVCRVRQSISQKILRFLLLPISRINQVQEVWKSTEDFLSWHSFQFLRATGINEIWNKSNSEINDQFPEVVTCGSLANAIEIPKLLKLGLAAQTLKKQQNAFREREGTEASITFSTVLLNSFVFLHEESENSMKRWRASRSQMHWRQQKKKKKRKRMLYHLLETRNDHVDFRNG